MRGFKSNSLYPGFFAHLVFVPLRWLVSQQADGVEESARGEVALAVILAIVTWPTGPSSPRFTVRRLFLLL
jgi:hypothetical protein